MADETRPNQRKTREGMVVSNAMEKTAVVTVIDRVRHPRYGKTVQRTSRLYVHDEGNEVQRRRPRAGARDPTAVPLKRWRVVEIVERAPR